MITNRHESKRHLIEYYLPFYYMFSMYDILFIGLGNIILIIIALLNLRQKKLYVKRSLKVYFPFVLWITIRDCIKILTLGNLRPLVNSMEYLVLFFSFFIISNNELDEDRLYKTWKIAGMIYSCGLLYHIIQLYVLHTSIQPISIIPGFTFRDSGVLSYRPCSFFPEPAAYASAMLPLVFISLKRREYYVALLPTIFIIASTSTVGIILLAVLWAYSIIISEVKLGTKIVIGVILVTLILFMTILPVFSDSFSKFYGVISGEGTYGIRVAVGFQIISTFNLSEWIIGSNVLDIYSFVLRHYSQLAHSKIVMFYYSAERLFLNSISYLIYHYGLMGLLFYGNTITRRIRNHSYPAKGLVIMHLVSLFGQSTMLNSLFFQTILLLSFYDEKQKR